MTTGKIIIFSAPSGSGKSTIVKHLLNTYPTLEFSISATSRQPRGNEKHGREYYFLSPDEFREAIGRGEFIEYEEVYEDCHYGTLKSEVERIWNMGKTILFDIDVKGGINLKRIFGDQALSVFIKPPSIEELRKRLITRGTDSTEAIDKRVLKAEEEMKYEEKFDTVLVNDDLAKALAEAELIVSEFCNRDGGF